MMLGPGWASASLAVAGHLELLRDARRGFRIEGDDQGVDDTPLAVHALDHARAEVLRDAPGVGDLGQAVRVDFGQASRRTVAHTHLAAGQDRGTQCHGLIGPADPHRLLPRYLFERLGGEAVLRGGLRVETTLDLELQAAAVASVREGIHDLDHKWTRPELRILSDIYCDEFYRPAKRALPWGMYVGNYHLASLPETNSVGEKGADAFCNARARGTMRQFGGRKNDEEKEEAHGSISSSGQRRWGPPRGSGSPPRTPPFRLAVDEARQGLRHAAGLVLTFDLDSDPKAVIAPYKVARDQRRQLSSDN